MNYNLKTCVVLLCTYLLLCLVKVHSNYKINHCHNQKKKKKHLLIFLLLFNF